MDYRKTSDRTVPGMATPEAGGWGSDAEDPRRGAGAARGTAWFPLTVFGLEMLASTPLFARFGVDGTACGTYCTALADLPRSAIAFLGGIATTGSPVIAAFWLVAALVGYLATGVFYRARSRRRGVGVSATPYICTGLGLLALLAAPTTIWALVFTDLFASGLTPLITVALALFVLARSHRSWPLGIFAVAFLGLVVLANLYDMSNLTYRMGLGSTGAQTNVLAVGAVLVLAGVTFAVTEARSR